MLANKKKEPRRPSLEAGGPQLLSCDQKLRLQRTTEVVDNHVLLRIVHTNRAEAEVRFWG
jgi:hypothetical protein